MKLKKKKESTIFPPRTMKIKKAKKLKSNQNTNALTARFESYDNDKSDFKNNLN